MPKLTKRNLPPLVAFLLDKLTNPENLYSVTIGGYFWALAILWVYLKVPKILHIVRYGGVLGKTPLRGIYEKSSGLLILRPKK